MIQAMLDSYSVARYRSFRDPVDLELRPLTLLFGYNNAGKSALLRALPLMTSSFAKRSRGPLDLQSPAVRGSVFSDLRCRLASTPGIELGLGWKSARDQAATRYRVTVRDLPELRRQVVSRFSIDRGDESLRAEWIPEEDAKHLGHRYAVEGSADPLELEWLGLTARSSTADDSSRSGRVVHQAMDELSRVASSVQWLGSMRALPRRSYTPSGSMPERLEHDGEGFADALFYDSLEGGELLDRVSSWFEDHFRSVLGLEDRGDEYHFTLDPVSKRGIGIHLVDTGEGVAQVLPVLVALEMARRSGGGVLALEQPELHLHPAAEVALARRLAEVASGADAPSLLVETHSENLMLAVQLCIAREELRPEDVLAYWVEKEDGESRLRRLEFDASGRVTEGWPHGVFAEDTALARELYLVRRGNDAA